MEESWKAPVWKIVTVDSEIKRTCPDGVGYPLVVALSCTPKGG